MFFEEAELQKLGNKIEMLRNEMMIIGIKEGLSSEKTICISQKLDDYIAKYHAQKTRLKNEPSFY